MSERALDKNQETATSGQLDLQDLRASKDLHNKESQHPSNQTDLSSVSISTNNIVRATHRPDPRRDPFSHNAAESPSPAATPGRNRSSETRAPGIFKNPTYRYSGGPISRLITFIANLLKVLERIFLRLLGARDLAAPTNQPQQAKQSPKTSPTEKKSQEKRAPLGWKNTTTRS
jgi:hypothetical protein